MGRKTILPAVTLAILIFLLLSGLQAVELVQANPNAATPVPQVLGLSPLATTMNLPVNNPSYESNNVSHAGVYAADFTDKERAFAFLSDVVGLNLASYEPIVRGSGPVNVNPVPTMLVGGTLINDTQLANGAGMSNLAYTIWFANNKVNRYTISGSSMKLNYTQPQPDNPLDMVKALLPRYQAYLEQYFGGDTAYIQSMIAMLNGVTELKAANITSGNIKLTISISNTSTISGYAPISLTQIAFGCLVDGVEIRQNGVWLSFTNNVMDSFGDSWGIYHLGAVSSVSKEEATQIAWEAAKNYNLTAEGITQPDWTGNNYEIGLGMVPGQTYNNTLNNALHFATGGNTTRDALGVYPLWQAVFYFGRSYGGTVGVQVGVWGDSKEIAYISTYGYLGTSPYQPTPAPTATPTPTQAPTPMPTQTPSPSPSPSPFASFSPSPIPSSPNSPTQQPTAETDPAESPIPVAFGIQTQDYTLTLAVLSIVAVAIVAGALVYLRKRK